MKLTKVNPTFTDHRGTISDIFYKESINHVGYITSVKGTVRGNHYHKLSTQSIFITKGSMRYWYAGGDNYDNAEFIVASEGDVITSEPYEIHAMEMLEDTDFIVFTSGPRGGEDYESDTFRVDSILRHSKSVLLLGQNGFIGSYLNDFMIRLGWKVYYMKDGYRLGDRNTSWEFSESMPHDVDYIIHLAEKAPLNLYDSMNGAMLDAKLNTETNLDILDMWKNYFHKKSKLIFASSLWSYPDNLTECKESDYWNGNLNSQTESFGAAKRFMTSLMNFEINNNDLLGTTMVFGNVYGAGDKSQRVVPALIDKFVKAKNDRGYKIHVNGSGEETRDLIYIEDLVQGIIANLENPAQIINISSGKSISVKEIVNNLSELFDIPSSRIIYDGNSIGSKNRSINVDVSRKFSGWPTKQMITDIKDGLKKTIEYIYNI